MKVANFHIDVVNIILPQPIKLTMKRRKFITGAAASTLVAGSLSTSAQNSLPEDKEYYELRGYSLRGASIPGALSTYLQEALIPALNRHGASKVGVFERLGKPQPTTCYVLIAYKNGANFLEMATELEADAAYQQAAKSFMDIGSDKVPYQRAESTLLEAFSGIPQMKVPPKSSELFELRIYESHNADAHRRKVKMFNEGELDIFYKTGLNPVFFGAARAGKYAPQLTYLLHFKDMEERDANWKKFIDHPDWDAMKNDPQYADTVSHITRYFLTRTSYSQI